MKFNRFQWRFVLFALPIIFLILFGSASFDSFFWTYQNLRILAGVYAWLQYLVIILILILITITFFFVLQLFPETSRKAASCARAFAEKRFPLLMLLFLSSIVALDYFLVHNLFNLKMIIIDDYPIHHLRGWYFIEVLIPKFRGLFGFSPYFWAGYPTLHFYPPGFYVVMTFLNLFGITIQASIRVFQFLIVVLYPLVPFLFCRHLGRGYTSSLTASFWVLYSVIWLKFLIFGMVPFLFAALLGSLFILLLLRFSENKKLASLSHILFSVILLSIIFIIHLTVAIFLAVVLILFVLYHFKWKTRSEARNATFFVSTVSILTLLSTLFLWLPVLMAYLHNLHVSALFGERSHPAWMLVWGLWEIFYRNIVWGFLLVLIIGVAFALKRRERRELFLIFVLGSSMVFVLMGLLGSGTPIEDLGLVRFLVFVEIFGSIFVGRFFDELIRFLKEIGMRYQKGHVFRKAGMKALCGSVVLILVFTSFLAAFSHVRNPLPKTVFDGDNYFSVLKEHEDHTLLNPNVEKVIQWIEQNTTSESRVMLEDSGETGFHFWGGHVPAIMPVLTGRWFIGGYQPIHWYCWSNLATCREGEAFNVEFRDMNITYFVDNLKRFNVRYLIFWSNYANRFAGSFPDDFCRVQTFGPYHIFNFTKAVDSYFWISSSRAEVEMVYFEPEKIVARVYNASKGDVLRLSMFKYPNYEAYLNKTKVNFFEGEPMMSLSMPESGDFELEIVWTKPLTETIATVISALTWLLMLCLLIHQWMKLVRH